MEQHCSTCDTTWVSNELVGCPTCRDLKKIELSGTLKLVNPKDYHFAPEGFELPIKLNWWQRFLDWLVDLVAFKRIF